MLTDLSRLICCLFDLTLARRRAQPLAGPRRGGVAHPPYDTGTVPGVRPHGRRTPRCAGSSRTSAWRMSLSLATIERETVHDVKAVEYYLRRRLPGSALHRPTPALPRWSAARAPGGCQQINLLCRHGPRRRARGLMPAATALTDQIARLWALATTCWREPRAARDADHPRQAGGVLTAWRLRRQLDKVAGRHTSASSTARPAPTARTLAAVPGRIWQEVSRTSVEHLGLTWNPLTTQIEPRLAGRAVCRPGALQPRAAQPLHRRVDDISARLLRPGPRSGLGRVGRARCRTRST